MATSQRKAPKTKLVKVTRAFMCRGTVVPVAQGEKGKDDVIVEAPLAFARELIANGKAEATDVKKATFDLPKEEDVDEFAGI